MLYYRTLLSFFQRLPWARRRGEKNGITREQSLIYFPLPPPHPPPPHPPNLTNFLLGFWMSVRIVRGGRGDCLGGPPLLSFPGNADNSGGEVQVSSSLFSFCPVESNAKVITASYSPFSPSPASSSSSLCVFRVLGGGGGGRNAVSRDTNQLC